MQRVLEPEYMDTTEESCSYAAMDHSAANDSIVAAFVAAGGDRCRRVLDIGTGPGDIPIRLARRCEKPRIVALDAAQTMLDLARDAIDDANLEDRITLALGDAKGLPFPTGAFDGVLSNTILHHIPDPVPFLREANRVLRAKRAVLVIRDLCRPPTAGAAQAIVDQHAASADARQRQLLYDSLCAALTLDEARAAVNQAGLRGATVARSSDRHYTITLQR